MELLQAGVDCSVPLDGVAVNLDATVVEEAREALPARESVADRLGELCLVADQAELLAQPRFEIGDNSAAPFLATHGVRLPTSSLQTWSKTRWRSSGSDGYKPAC